MISIENSVQGPSVTPTARTPRPFPMNAPEVELSEAALTAERKRKRNAAKKARKRAKNKGKGKARADPDDTTGDDTGVSVASTPVSCAHAPKVGRNTDPVTVGS